MTRYAKIEDGSVVDVAPLPKNYENVSNFYLLSNKELKNYGFKPVSTVRPSYDSLTQKLEGPSYNIKTDNVEEEYTVVDLSQSEIDSKLSPIKDKLRVDLNRIEAETDWIFLSDISITQTQKDKYKSLRTSIRTTLDNLDSLGASEVSTLKDKVKAALDKSCLRLRQLDTCLNDLKTYLENLNS